MTTPKKDVSRQALNFTVRRAEMEYNEPTSHLKTDLKVVVLARGRTRGYPFVILNMVGNHPTAYIGVPTDHPLYGLRYDDLNNSGVVVHGGFTYASDEMPRSNVKDVWWLGWDYAHALAGDYTTAIDSGKKWTREEILADVKDVAAQLDSVGKS